MTAVELAGNHRHLGVAVLIASLILTYPEAYEALVRARLLYREDGRILGLGNAIRTLGDLDLELERYDEALDHYEEARDLFVERGDRLAVAWLQFCIARLERDREREEEARTAFEAAEVMFREVQDPHGVVGSLMELGRLASETDPARAGHPAPGTHHARLLLTSIRA